MSEYWLMDPEGGVLGPVSLVVLQDLGAAGHILPESQVSTNGHHFRRVAELPEVAAALFPAASDRRRSQDLERAAAVHRDLARFRTLSANELFGVSERASRDEFKEGYLAISRRYHPARLPPDAHPELVQRHREMFMYLGERMKAVEGALPRGPNVADQRSVPPTDNGSRLPRAAPLSQPSGPRATQPLGGSSEPVSLPKVTLSTGSGDRLRATIDVNQDQVGIFVSHRIVNLASGGFFLPTQEALSLGARIDLLFRFTPPPKEIQARGVVVLESAFAAREQREHGVGIRLDALHPTDRDYLHAFVERGRARAR